VGQTIFSLNALIEKEVFTNLQAWDEATPTPYNSTL
jgi:hypothetical protein